MIRLSNKQVVYVHIEKCGGSSIIASLKPYINIHTPEHHRCYNGSVVGKFVFTTVRNPWSRLVSWYHYMKQHDDYQYMDQYNTFKEWISQCSLCGTMAIPVQQMHVKVTGDIKVYKLEYLHEQWSTILTSCGVWKPLQRFIKLKHDNKSSHKDYKSYYDIQTRAMVAGFVREDAERFGYTFDN